MKSAGQIVLVAMLLAGASARTGEAAVSGKPYAAMVARNIFNLVPIPTNTAPEPPPADPPPRITLNGIMSIFGKWEALFKVAPQNRPGQPPAKEEAYVLSEGERQDEIEVIKIDESASLVTFNNHGFPQELSLTNASNSSGPAPAGGGAGIPGLAPLTRGLLPGGAGVSFSQGRNLPGGNSSARGNPATGGNPNASAMPSVGGAVSGGIYNPPPQENLSPEAQVLLIEKNRLDTQDLVDKGLMPPLPPTPLTPADATAAGGLPLIANPGIPKQ
jgi:hypothetical protein